jgi:hypothetical protein
MTLIGIAAIGFLLLATIGARGLIILFLIVGTVVVVIAGRSPLFDAPAPPLTEAQRIEKMNTPCSAVAALPPEEQAILHGAPCH